MLLQLGVRRGLRFTDAVKCRKRQVRKLSSGVPVFGYGPLPVPPCGRSSRDMPPEGDRPPYRSGGGENAPTMENSAYLPGETRSEASRTDRSATATGSLRQEDEERRR